MTEDWMRYYSQFKTERYKSLRDRFEDREIILKEILVTGVIFGLTMKLLSDLISLLSGMELTP